MRATGTTGLKDLGCRELSFKMAFLAFGAYPLNDTNLVREGRSAGVREERGEGAKGLWSCGIVGRLKCGCMWGYPGDVACVCHGAMFNSCSHDLM